MKITREEKEQIAERGKTQNTAVKWQQAQILIEKVQSEQGCFAFSERRGDRDRHWGEEENTYNA